MAIVATNQARDAYETPVVDGQNCVHVFQKPPEREGRGSSHKCIGVHRFVLYGAAVGRSRKDNRRRITVDGVVYRYTVSPDDGFIALIARPENACGQRLWVKFGYHDEWLPAGEGAHRSAGHRLILPRVVRLAILDGIRRGWNPAATKPGLFRVHDGDSLLPPEEWPRFSK